MHPFPELPQLQFLIGSDLEQICLGIWQIDLSFSKGAISVQGDLEHLAQDGSVRRHNTDEDRLAPICLHHLLGQKVCTVEREPFLLALGFEGGDTIRIFSEDGPYESGHLYNEAGLMTVF